MNKKGNKKNWFGLLSVFISSIVFVSILIIICKYGVTTAFFQFDNPNGLWEKIINIGIFWVIGVTCINEFVNGLKEFKGGNQNE